MWRREGDEAIVIVPGGQVVQTRELETHRHSDSESIHFWRIGTNGSKAGDADLAGKRARPGWRTSWSGGNGPENLSVATTGGSKTC